MTEIQVEVLLKTSLARVYGLIAQPGQIALWWVPHRVVASAQGLMITHDPGPEHGDVALLVREQQPYQRIVWECISSHPASSPAAAWTGTQFVFELAPAESDPRSVRLRFRQLGYDASSPFFAFNRTAWQDVIQSLKRVAEAHSEEPV